jgi:hypothetical protein
MMLAAAAAGIQPYARTQRKLPLVEDGGVADRNRRSTDRGSQRLLVPEEENNDVYLFSWFRFLATGSW